MAAVKIALASQSSIRRRLLESAGVSFYVCPTSGDEEEAIATATAQGLAYTDIALSAARAKALGAVVDPDTFVIAADQLLVVDHQILRKAVTLAAARQRLNTLRGGQHLLVTSAVIARNHQLLFEQASAVEIQMRVFSDAELENYLDKYGNDILSSVSCYEIEGAGIQLISEINGDYFSALGLPLIEVLEGLRKCGAIVE